MLPSSTDSASTEESCANIPDLQFTTEFASEEHANACVLYMCRNCECGAALMSCAPLHVCELQYRAQGVRL